LSSDFVEEKGEVYYKAALEKAPLRESWLSVKTVLTSLVCELGLDENKTTPSCDCVVFGYIRGERGSERRLSGALILGFTIRNRCFHWKVRNRIHRKNLGNIDGEIQELYN